LRAGSLAEGVPFTYLTAKLGDLDPVLPYCFDRLSQMNLFSPE